MSSPPVDDDDRIWRGLVRAEGRAIDDASRARLRADLQRVVAGLGRSADSRTTLVGRQDRPVAAVDVSSGGRVPRRSRRIALAAAAVVVLAGAAIWFGRAGHGEPRPGTPVATADQTVPAVAPAPTSAPQPTVSDGDPLEDVAVEVELGLVGGYPDLGIGGFGWRFTDADGVGIEVDDGEVYGPSGFGLDAAGAVYVMDAVNHRVRVVAGGSDQAVPLPAELAGTHITAFAVAPDGTQYVTLLDGAAAFRGDRLIGRSSVAELGWSGSVVGIGADDRGMWARQLDGSWVLGMLPDGSAAPPGTTSAADSEPGIDPGRAVAFEWSGDDLVLRTVDGFAGPIRVSAEPRLDAVHSVTRVGNDVLLVASAGDPASASSRLVIVLVRPDGSYARGYTFWPEGTLTAVGPYVRVHGSTVYVESADAEMLLIAKFPLDELVPAD